MQLLNAISERRSVRNFTGNPLNDAHKRTLQEYLAKEENLKGPFGNSVRILYNKQKERKKSEKIGTYGFIKNAPAYLICICKNNEETLIDLGYIFEHLVLFLQTHKIGTCWMGGTFTRKKLQLNTELNDDEFIPIISPVGYAADKKHTVEKIIRTVAKSNHRKDPDELFYNNDFETPLQNSKTKELAEYIRVAPSASNKQPWRLVFTDNKITHFYIKRTPAYAKSVGYDMQIIDIGIALAHYRLSIAYKEIFRKEPDIELKDENLEYVFTVK
jgi:nitroreductase